MKKSLVFVFTIILTLSVTLSSTVLAGCFGKNDNIQSSATVNEDTPDQEFIEHTSGLTHNLVTFYETVRTHEVKYKYEDMVVDLYAMSAQYKHLVDYESQKNIFHVENIGLTHDGRVIECAVLGNPDADRQIVIQAGIHGREYLTSMLVMRQIEYYLDNYETGSYNGVSFKYILNQFAFYIIPMANPDGIVIAEEGIDSVRSEELRAGIEAIYQSDLKKGYAKVNGKDMSLDSYLEYWKANAKGVDLNRNYDADWESYESESEPCFLNFKGYAPESEPETKATVEFINSLPNIVASLAIHSQGEMIYWDCGQDYDILKKCESIAETLKKLNGYTISQETIRDSSFTDWLVLEKNIPAVTVEIGDGDGHSLLTIDKFYKVWDDNSNLLLALAEKYIN